MCMEQPLLRPTNDYVFKRIFGDESNKAVLISLLRAVLQIEIKDITLLQQEIPRDGPDLKGAILDIVAQLDDGTRVDIEMQVKFQPDYIDRVLFYHGELFTIQFEIGKPHGKASKTIAITIVNDNTDFFPHAHSIYVLAEHRNDPWHVLTDKLELHFVILSRIDEIEISKGNKELILWMKFLVSRTREEMEPLAEQNECIDKAYQTLQYMSQDPEERIRAWSREKFLWDQETRENTAREEGIEIGEKKGREEGRKEGREEGREEGIIQTAKAMLAEGVDIEIVCKATGLKRTELLD